MLRTDRENSDLLKDQSNKLAKSSQLTAQLVLSCKDFSAFFTSKASSLERERKVTADKLVTQKSTQEKQSAQPAQTVPKNNAHWSTFKLYDQEDIAKTLLSLKPNNHYNDPLPAKCWPTVNLMVIPSWTKIINASLSQGSFPDCLKTGQAIPLLKKPTEKPSDPNNFRPVINIPLLA